MLMEAKQSRQLRNTGWRFSFHGHTDLYGGPEGSNHKQKSQYKFNEPQHEDEKSRHKLINPLSCSCRGFCI